MCVVPVWVGHRNSRKMVKTYAMLDNCSQGSFIKNEIIKDLLRQKTEPESDDINW